LIPELDHAVGGVPGIAWRTSETGKDRKPRQPVFNLPPVSLTANEMKAIEAKPVNLSVYRIRQAYPNPWRPMTFADFVPFVTIEVRKPSSINLAFLSSSSKAGTSHKLGFGLFFASDRPAVTV
jgi:hypothetical protein